jgi:hypothetical protein
MGYALDLVSMHTDAEQQPCVRDTMNDSTGVVRRPQRVWRPTVRTAATIICTATSVLLAAACSGSPSSGGSSHAGGSSISPSAVGYSRCMRSNGVPDFPDPDSKGNLPPADPQQLAVSSSQLQAAQTTCQHLLPNGGSLEQQTERCINGGDSPPALVRRILTAGRRFARCMRSHGAPNWPDPTIDSRERPAFAISVSKDLGGVDVDSSQIRTKVDECDHLMPGAGGVPLAVSP